MNSPPPRVPAVAIGYNGFGNAGDEAILTGVEALLRPTSLQVNAIICGPGPVPAFTDARRLVTRRLRPTFAAIRALRGARVLLITGGGLLHDHWVTVVPTYLAWVLIGRALGLRIAWLGVGVGPLRSRTSRWSSAAALRLSTLVMVRDAGSAELVREIAPRVHPVVVPDPAIHNAPAGARERLGIGVVARGPTPRDVARAEPMASALGGLVLELEQRGTPVELLTFGGAADTPFAGRVADHAAGAGARPPIHELPADPATVIDALAGFKALVSVRLHGLILGALAGTPAVTIAYDPKVCAAAARLALSDYCVPMEGLSTAALADALHRLLASDAAPAQLADRVSELRDEAAAVRSLLAVLE